MKKTARNTSRPLFERGVFGKDNAFGGVVGIKPASIKVGRG
jgi:hypothetical protein